MGSHEQDDPVETPQIPDEFFERDTDEDRDEWMKNHLFDGNGHCKQKQRPESTKHKQDNNSSSKNNNNNTNQEHCRSPSDDREFNELFQQSVGYISKDSDEKRKDGDDEQQEERYDYSSLQIITISDAARLHAGHVKTRGVISTIIPLTKLAKSFNYECQSCHAINEISGVKWAGKKPMLFQETKKPRKCTYCEVGDVFDPRCEYVNAIIIEIRDQIPIAR